MTHKNDTHIDARKYTRVKSYNRINVLNICKLIILNHLYKKLVWKKIV